MSTTNKPEKLLIDQNYDVFRRLDPMEIEPTLSTIFGDKNAIIVVPAQTTENGDSSFKQIADQLKGREKQVRIIADEEMSESDIRSRSLFVLGRPDENQIAKRLSSYLPAGFSNESGRFSLNGNSLTEPVSELIVMRNPFNSDKVIALYCGSTPEEMLAASRKLLHYGNYAYLSFNGGNIAEKGIIEAASNPLVHTF